MACAGINIDFDNLTVQSQRKVSLTKTDGLQVGPTPKNSKRTLPLKEEFAEFLCPFRSFGYIISGAPPIDPHTWPISISKFFEEICKLSGQKSERLHRMKCDIPAEPDRTKNRTIFMPFPNFSVIPASRSQPATTSTAMLRC